MSHVIFESKEFPDAVILKQLESMEHQVLLSEHDPSWLYSFGFCTVSIARSLNQCKTREESLEQMKKSLNSQINDPFLRTILNDRGVPILKALRIVAESYLSRSGRGIPSWASESDNSTIVSNVEIILEGKTGKYKPKELLAKGSAGLVYLAEKEGVSCKYVVKRVYPTQYDSAVNEFQIATRLKDCSRCLAYLDCIHTGKNEIWLVLPLVERSEKYGVDLREYITKGFFQQNEIAAQHIVIQLLEGLDQVSSHGIIMRDVKPDNVLVKCDSVGKFECCYWTDFGLSVDLGPDLDGSNIRKVDVSTCSNMDDEEFCNVIVGWWYDTCKLVPRPKWKARGPPERTFQNPKEASCYTYDIYMLGIIIVCIAVGIDIPHIDQPDCKSALEQLLNKSLPGDYLKSFELGKSLNSDSSAYLLRFEKTFQPEFGRRLFDLTKAMLSEKPNLRPSPKHCLNMLQ